MDRAGGASSLALQGLNNILKKGIFGVCMSACMRACVRVCVRVHVHACRTEEKMGMG